jgi:uncharacterized protein (UPF0303 family)
MKGLTMTHHQTEPGSSTAADPEFDPDYPGPQPEHALQSLIRRIEDETRTLQFTKFDRHDALALGLLLVELGTTRNLPIAIDIRQGDHILFHASLTGATADNGFWVERKSRTAQRYEAPSLLVGLRGRLGGGRLEDNAWFDQVRYATHGGSFPLCVRGTGLVGTVTVSGLPQKADHDLIVEALSLFLRSDA